MHNFAADPSTNQQGQYVAPRAIKEWGDKGGNVNMRRKLAALVSTAGLLCTLTLTAGFALAAGGNPSASLDQCANDQAPSPSSNGCNSSATQWVNGNLGASKSVYNEGDSIPYRLTFLNLSTSGSHNVKIEWDTTKSGKHALDYLTTYTASVLNANACLGITQSPACTSAASTFPIPKDPQVDPGTPSGTGAIGGQPGGNFTIYGGNITGVSAYSYSNGTGFVGDKSASLVITFTASVANPVIAWGGHIATRLAWGVGLSTVAISGSPYHTRLLDLDGSGGNQDRSLSADAVVFPGSITIIKSASPEGSTSFPFAASPSPLSNFNLVDDGTATDRTTFPITTAAGFQSYTVTENTPAGWSLTGIVCGITSPNGGSATGSGSTATINLKEGENATCTFSNLQQNPALNITKSASVPGGTANVAGEKISYTITVQNTGNVTLTGVTVTDPFADSGSIVRGADVVGDNDSSLEVGETWGYTAFHTVTQAEIDNGGNCDKSAPVGNDSLCNTATADSNQTGEDTASADVPVGQNPALDIVKTVSGVTNPDNSADSDGVVDQAGDVIHYTITVQNTGNVTLTGVTVTDPFADSGSIVRGTDVSGDNDNLLEVGETWSYTAKHTVTAAELAAGGNTDTSVPPDGLNDTLRNVATADSNESEPDTDDADAPVKAQPGIVTTDILIPQDTIVLSKLTTNATGVLTVTLHLVGTDCTSAAAYTKVWASNYPISGDAAFTGNGSYSTSNTVSVDDDATIRWCVSYSGDDHNAAIPLGDHGEVSVVDFNPFITGAIGFAIPMALWALWSRRRRERED
jgi:uncharacterized repeat protein (TIGR01451 family)